ncbi:NAD dependent epimerase/dehydratase [Aspergillus ellipticus CBS 707.79]|uniref:NAD dependent epimerase/dehydratase n=1 Tax=Aspergillus ellipticus CBS 707.79 TaxID=1448320 RepID=A0A319DMY5_9EURO|nr:NAD dependent epimerase/dehydratase [Aspergillus ellipticus CBS 707.79]
MERSFGDPYPRLSAPGQRQKEMKVLALGMSRTGTMSLYVALKELGYTCYHMCECSLDNANDSMILWRKALDAKYEGTGTAFKGKEDFDKMLWRYDAVTDVPCILFVEELLDAYPDAQIILTNREVGPWKCSLESTFYPIINMKRWKILEAVDKHYIAPYLSILRSSVEVWTGGKNLDKQHLPDGFNAHYDLVRAAAKERGREILEYRVQEGWQPLCQFLGKDMPDKAFPKVNEGTWVVTMHYYIFWARFMRLVIACLMWATSVAVLTIAWWLFR